MTNEHFIWAYGGLFEKHNTFLRITFKEAVVLFFCRSNAPSFYQQSMHSCASVLDHRLLQAK